MTASTAMVDDVQDVPHKRLSGRSGKAGGGGVVAGLFFLRRSLGNQLLIALGFISILAALHILIERHELTKAAEQASHQSAAKMRPLSTYEGAYEGAHTGTTDDKTVPVVSYTTTDISVDYYTSLEDGDYGKAGNSDWGSHKGLEQETEQLSKADGNSFEDPLDDPPASPQQKLDSETERKLYLNDQPLPPSPKIFDFIMLNNELDELEIRLQELELDIDRFYIIESDTTFSGKPKPLHFRENRARFQRFLDKIVHIVVPGPQKPPPPQPAIESSRDMEISQRPTQDIRPTQTPLEADETVWKEYLEAINDWESKSRSQGLFMALDIHRPEENDWILLADLDEIPKPKTLQAFRTQDPLQSLGTLELPLDYSVSLVRLLCDSYYYSYEFKVEGRSKEVGPMMIRFMEHSTVAKERARQAQLPSTFQDPSLEFLFELSENDWMVAGGRLRELARSEARNKMIGLPKSCWHCSWCFATMRQVRAKLDARSHTELDKKEYWAKDWILDRVRSGKDLMDRPHLQYEYLANNTDVPSTLIMNKDRYSFMLERKDRDDAGFLDVLTYSGIEDDDQQLASQ